jgi:hypothetical protein
MTAPKSNLTMLLELTDYIATTVINYDHDGSDYYKVAEIMADTHPFTADRILREYSKKSGEQFFEFLREEFSRSIHVTLAVLGPDNLGQVEFVDGGVTMGFTFSKCDGDLHLASTSNEYNSVYGSDGYDVALTVWLICDIDSMWQ